MSYTNSYRVGKPTRRTQTCDLCKSRHQKCNGAQPRCNNCELRAISCSYSNVIARVPEQATRSPQSSLAASTETPSQPSISNVEYDRLYSQIFGDIVRRLNLEGNPVSEIHGEASAQFRPSNASLPSIYEEVSNILKEQVTLDGEQTPSQMDDSIRPSDQIKDPALEQNLQHIRKILRDSLPTQDTSLRLLYLFFKYQNCIFYVCNENETQEQLGLMYEDPDQVSISRFCQMFLIFAVGVQFDDVDDDEGESYYEISQKYINDAIDENPQDTLWITRAMLLLCLYQPPKKWNSIWIYLDAAIRGAHRFQLDLGHNLLKEISDEQYQEWRQLWLTIVSFDRWVAIFLGRVPRIKESISRDPIFKELRFESSLDCCLMQNYITGLAIISGNILRDMYFSEQFSLSVCRRHKTELETWMSNLPGSLRQRLESGVVLDLPEDQLEAAFNLHFMRLGTWMLLTRPSLLKAVKFRSLATNFAGPIGSAISTDASLCIDSALRLINSGTAMLSISLPPKRSFMPLFFLVNAAHILILGVVWKLKQSGKDYGPLVSYDQSPELAGIDKSIRTLDFCGQRNAFARKYSTLIKDLRQRLTRGMANSGSDMTSPSPGGSRIISLNMTPYSATITGSSQSSVNQEYMAETPVFQNGCGDMDERSISTSSLSKGDIVQGHDLSVGAGNEDWAEEFGIFYPNDASSYDSTALLRNSNELEFLDDMLQ